MRDIDASTTFYRDVLGFAVKQTVPDAPPFDDLHGVVSKKTPPAMPLTKQFYGMREFAVTDPDDT